MDAPNPLISSIIRQGTRRSSIPLVQVSAK